MITENSKQRVEMCCETKELHEDLLHIVNEKLPR